jgi:hypothetical protein
MKHLKRYNEGFLDYFKKNTPDDKITLDMINRLEKVKDINPYQIYPLTGDGKKMYRLGRVNFKVQTKVIIIAKRIKSNLMMLILL